MRIMIDTNVFISVVVFNSKMLVKMLNDIEVIHLTSRLLYLLHDLIPSPQGGGKALTGGKQFDLYLRALWRGFYLRKLRPPGRVSGAFNH